MDTNTFFWGLISALVVAGLGFGAKKIINKNSNKSTQNQNGNENIAIYKSKDVQVTVGSEKYAKKDNQEDKK
ncbi:hypothetical protein MKZ20_21880 [Psychrobacillus sp. FSL K6-2684]|uniref:hypothetical protein n=1 Tax=unclassified Psychrobacillus TaxID=2636677 RepID=UPI0030F6F58B